MTLSLEQYRSKLLGCWTGKNIGGTLGAPFECKRGVFEISGYTQDISSGPLPNDDLDLQLVWLNAAEKHGRLLNASILGEYWLCYVIPNWGEYGAGKNNLRMGILPPLSGLVNNAFKDSCGAFILSEIWACLAPGHPEIAVRYAYEDAIVNHSGEGVYAEVFCAAVESAAFAQSDAKKLIDIGLSYIPEDCGVARGVLSAVESFQAGLGWREARKALLNAVPGSFGAIGTLPEDMELDVPVGPMGWDAPSNIGIIILGWLYGGGDFGKSLCIAAGCGEDADCTAGTLGAILGIIGGDGSIPENWKEPLGGKINTLCINRADLALSVPGTVDELTERILRLTPEFLGGRICDCVHADHGYSISMPESGALFEAPRRVNAWSSVSFKDTLALQPYCVSRSCVLFDTILRYGAEPFIAEGNPVNFTLTVRNNLLMQQWLTVAWLVPEGWEVLPGAQTAVSLEQYHCNVGSVSLEYTLVPHGVLRHQYDLVAEIGSIGHHTKEFLPVTLLHRA